jgi:hypothetical protein
MRNAFTVTRSWRREGWRCLFILALMVFCGCGRDGAGDEAGAGEEKSPAWAYEEEFGPGPVTLVLRLDRTEVGLADTLTLEQELRVEEGFEGEFPEYLPEDFEGLAVVDIEVEDIGSGQEEPAPPRRTRKRVTLEPEISGELAVAPLAVYFHRQGEKKEDYFLTDEIKITVQGIDDPEDLAVRGPRDILEAPPAEAGGSPLLWAAAGSVLVLVLAIGVVWFLVRRPRRLPPPPPPHEIAWEALRRLVEQQFIERGEIELFYVHLSGILRHYIENRFHVRAPERTTEEFLEEAARSPALARHRVRLGEFLGLCDQVKFALYMPETATIQSSFDVVKRFIEETTSNVA